MRTCTQGSYLCTQTLRTVPYGTRSSDHNMYCALPVVYSVRTTVSHEDDEEVSTMLAIAITLPASTAGCERGFSTQNRLKTKLRNRLLEGKLDILMRLSIEGPSVN